MSEPTPPPYGDVPQQPPPQPGGYGAPPPPQPGGYGAPPPAQPGYGAPQYGQPQYGAPQYGGAPGGAPGYGQQQGLPRPGEVLDRFLARLIDGVLLGVVFGILYGILFAILVSSTTIDYNTGKISGGSTILFYLVFAVLSTVVNVGYYVFLESSRGQTIGKMVMKLKTVGPDGVSNPTTAQAFKRNIFTAWTVLYIIPVAGAFLAPLAALAAFVGEILIAVGISNDTVKRQAWHDHFAGETQVLKVG